MVFAETVAAIAALSGSPRRGFAALGVRGAVNLIAVFIDVAFVLDQVGFVGRLGLVCRLPRDLLRRDRRIAVWSFRMRRMGQKSKR